MTYRERQIRLILKQQQAKWAEEKNILQQDIYQLENSADIKVVDQLKKKGEEYQKAFNDIVKTLGPEIHNLKDLRDLLQGQTVQELTTTNNLYRTKIGDLESSLLKLGKTKLANQKEAKELLTKLEQQLKEKEEEWNKKYQQKKKQQEQDREHWSSELAKSKGVISELEKENKKQTEEIKTLTNQNNKLNEKVEELEEKEQEHLKKLSEQKTQLEQKERDKQDLLEQIKEAGWTADKLQKEKDGLVLEKNGLKEDLQSKEDEIKTLQTNLNNAWNDNSKLAKEFNEQWKRVNLLFDPDAANYETIDFNGLYALLEKVSREREREREREQNIEPKDNLGNVIEQPQPTKPLSKKEKRKQKKT